MKKSLLLILFSATIINADPIDLYLGPSLQYGRFHQNCLDAQKGFLSGPSAGLEITYPWRPYFGLFFDGLWSVANFCSEDGLFINSAQYNTMMKLGFNFGGNNTSFIVTPYTGVGFLHLSHELKKDLITYKYNNVYIPLGLRFLHELSECFSWEFLIHYRADAYTRLKVSTPCLCDTDDCKIKLKRTDGVFASLPLTWTYGQERRVGFITKLTPTFDWQRFNCPDDCCENGVALNIPQLKHWKLGFQAMLGITF